MKALNIGRHLRDAVAARVGKVGASYTLYGWFGLLNAPIYYLIWRYAAPETYENGWLRLLCAVLCLGLVLHRYWSKRWQPWLPLYWYVTLFTTLPFFFSFNLMMNAGSAMWIANNILMVFFVLLLVDSLSAILLLAIGSLLGIAAAVMLLLSTTHSMMLITTFNYRGFFITYIVAIIIGTLFSRHREQLEILIRRNIQLEAECKEKSLFIANLSHDLRTPLSGLLSLAEVELQRLSPTDDLYPTLTTMHQSSQQLHHLFESLLETAKLEHGTQQLPEHQVFCMATLCKQIQQLFQPVIISKGLRLQLVATADDSQQSLLSYPVLIERILIHLISNAIKFTEQGTITLRWQLQRPTTIKKEKRTTKLMITVADTGQGMTPAVRSQIFKAFKQAMPAYKQADYTGAGLGLYNVKKILKKIGGEIDVASEGKNCGSAFTCTLPVDLTAAISNNDTYVMTAPELTTTAMSNPQPMKAWKSLSMAQPPETQSTAITFRLLLVEDSRLARMAAIRVLQSVKAHCQIHQADTAASALKKATTHAYDAILMDIGLPDGDGRLITQKIRESKQSKNRHTPIVALTAHANDNLRQECLAMGIV
ncbi:MAG: hybrid sensor histidine kinase/response regulator [Gammaproteobacteria bacterium]|nr:hybrid sensor histidine kinase/response regulator [Gammaproteobacteria bacterium]